MGNIDTRRWRLTGTSDRDAIARGPRLAVKEKVDVVPASQLRGAVSMRDAAESFAGHLLSSPDRTDQEYGRRLSAALDAAMRGQ